MNVKKQILAIKYINSDHKLVLAAITNEFVPSMGAWCELTTQELANELGMSYKEIADILWDLQEMNLIKTVVEHRIRTTKVTALYKRVTTIPKEIKEAIIKEPII